MEDKIARWLHRNRLFWVFLVLAFYIDYLSFGNWMWNREIYLFLGIVSFIIVFTILDWGLND